MASVCRLGTNAYRPLGGEVVAADEAEGLAELRPHQRRRAEHQAGDELLDQLLCGVVAGTSVGSIAATKDYTTIALNVHRGISPRASLAVVGCSMLWAAVC